MFSMCVAISSVFMVVIFAGLGVYLGNNEIDKNIEKAQQNRIIETKEFNQKHLNNDLNSIQNNIIIQEDKTIHNINTYDFKNTENGFLYIVLLFLMFIIFKKYNVFALNIKSFVYTVKTKRILKKISQLNSEQIFDITNISEVQILKNRHLLNLNKNAVELSTYNDLLVSKHNSIIEKISY